MTGYEIYENAMLLAGLVDSGGNTRKNLSANQILSVINESLSDLCGKTCKNVFDEIDVEDGVKEALICAAARFLAGLEGDRARCAFFSKIYQKKRAKVKFNISSVKMMPV